jgi:hypothetical protein
MPDLNDVPRAWSDPWTTEECEITKDLEDRWHVWHYNSNTRAMLENADVVRAMLATEGWVDENEQRAALHRAAVRLAWGQWIEGARTALKKPRPGAG